MTNQDGTPSVIKPAGKIDASGKLELAGAQRQLRNGGLPCTGAIAGNAGTMLRSFTDFRNAYLAQTKLVTVPDAHPLALVADLECKLIEVGYPILPADAVKYPEYIALVSSKA